MNPLRSAVLTGRRLLLAGVVAACLVPALPALGQKPDSYGHIFIQIDAKPLAGFASRDPQHRQFGALEFRGGMQLTSTHRDFGGISSIRMEADGERFLAVTDKGQWLRGRIRYSGSAPVAIESAEMAPVLAADGRPITARRWYDTEALAIDGGTAYVAVERVHRILWFDFAKYGMAAPGRPLRVPAEFKRLPSNKGIEGLVMVPEGLPLAGTLVAISERALDPAGHIRGFLIGGRDPGTFSIRRTDEFDITDVALSPRGDLLILERSFSLLRGPRMRVRRVALAEVRPGARVDGPVLIEADAGYQIDNMEALAVHRTGAGEIVLTIVSD
ncbi:MAG TPA: esterase-like activity of phytase family protein, partial [Xanthobacteraceae bacterium]|nr:esterase-like activity of phytase family protein [Xanthobacteraceae bacterium]